MINDRLHTCVQAAQALGLSPATIRLWIRQRKIGYVRLGRAVRIPPSEIHRLVNGGMVPALSCISARTITKIRVPLLSNEEMRTS